jgi:hypothetical protein
LVRDLSSLNRRDRTSGIDPLHSAAPDLVPLGCLVDAGAVGKRLADRRGELRIRLLSRGQANQSQQLKAGSLVPLGF